MFSNSNDCYVTALSISLIHNKIIKMRSELERLTFLHRSSELTRNSLLIEERVYNGNLSRPGKRVLGASNKEEFHPHPGAAESSDVTWKVTGNFVYDTWCSYIVLYSLFLLILLFFFLFFHFVLFLCFFVFRSLSLSLSLNSILRNGIVWTCTLSL
jgi:hypothetical protein